MEENWKKKRDRKRENDRDSIEKVFESFERCSSGDNSIWNAFHRWILWVFITVNVVVYSSPLLFSTMLYLCIVYWYILYIVSDAGHDGQLYRSPHTLCVIKFVDCVSTWIQIICCGTMGFWCGSFFFFFLPFHIQCSFNAFFGFGLFVLLNLFGLLLLLVSSNQTRIQRNALALKRIGWFFCHIWTFSKHSKQ